MTPRRHDGNGAVATQQQGDALQHTNWGGLDKRVSVG